MFKKQNSNTFSKVVQNHIVKPKLKSTYEIVNNNIQRLLLNKEKLPPRSKRKLPIREMDKTMNTTFRVTIPSIFYNSGRS